jgi:hypothetical protein
MKILGGWPFSNLKMQPALRCWCWLVVAREFEARLGLLKSTSLPQLSISTVTLFKAGRGPSKIFLFKAAGWYAACEILNLFNISIEDKWIEFDDHVWTMDYSIRSNNFRNKHDQGRKEIKDKLSPI